MSRPLWASTIGNDSTFIVQANSGVSVLKAQPVNTSFTDAGGTTIYPQALFPIAINSTSINALPVAAAVDFVLTSNPTTGTTRALSVTGATAAANAGITNTLETLMVEGMHRGAGSLATIRNVIQSTAAASCGPITTLRGLRGQGNVLGATVTTANGLMGQLVLSGSGTTVTTAICVDTTLSLTTPATVSGDIKFYNVSNLTNTGTITGTTYGLYIGDITTGTQTGGAFSVYAADASAPSRFVGAVTIDGALTLTTTLTVPNGGTGATTFASNAILIGHTTSPLTGTADFTYSASNPYTLTVGGTTSGNKVLTMGGTPGDNSAVFLNLLASTTQKNWRINTNSSVAGALEFTPSTATGGSTFTTPAVVYFPSSGVSIGDTTDPGSTNLRVAGSLLAVSTATASAFIPTGASVPTNGTYLPAANTIGWATNSTLRLQIDTIATSSVVFQGPSGTIGGPTWSFSTDTNTGIYRLTTDTVGLVGNGRDVASFGASAVGYNVGVIYQNAAGTGAGKYGASLTIQRNTSGSGAPGLCIVTDRTGVDWALWVDSTGKVRVGSTFPDEASGDLIGTVVGTQT